MIDRLSDGLGDLPADVVGGNPHYLKIGIDDIAQETTDLDRVLAASLSDKCEGKTTLIFNSEYRTSAQGPKKEPADIQKQKDEVIQSARWMNMQNESGLKVEQYLERFADEGVLSHAEASSILAERPLHGQLYLDRNATGKCVDIRHASQKSVARQALWVVMAPGCELCNSRYGFCPESGKKLIANVPATKEELREASRHLMESGRILSDARIADWDDLKRAMSPPKSEIGDRVYPHASPVVEAAPPKMDARAQDDILRKVGSQKEKDNATIGETINAREILPIARAIGELLLKGTDLEIVRKEVERKFPDKMRIKSAIDFLHRNASSELLLTHMAAVPALYGGNCEKCRQFLHENGIRVAAVLPINQCVDCQRRKNLTHSCSLIGARILEDGVRDADVNQAIDELRVEGRLSSRQAQELKDNRDAGKRLNEAVRLSYNGEKKNRITESASESGKPNALVLSAQNFAIRENAVLWAVGALAKTATVTQIRKELSKVRADADQIICDAMATTKTVHAESLDTCTTDHYAFSNSGVIRSVKCDSCPYADELQCRRHGLIFSQVSMGDLDNGETSEAKEVLDYFKDTAVVAEIDPNSTNKTIDIKFPNEGASMVVDLGPSNAITNYQQIYDLLPQDIEIGSKKGGVPPLEVQGLGAAEGFDLSGMF